MPVVSAYRHGVPAWIDVSSPDVETTAAFYAGLFGWELGPDLGPDSGHYRLFTKDGHVVAGIGPLMDGVPSWTTYIAVDDATAAAEAITAAGGTVVVAPMDLPDGAGRMAIASDPAGAFFAVFQAGPNHRGCELVNEPGTLVWSELNVKDPDAVRSFYETVFGWTTELMPEMNYRTVSVAGRAIGGVMAMGEGYPEGIPPHWLAYFDVEDCAATAARAGELGGTVLSGPMDTPPGPIAVIADPTGAVFAIGTFALIDDPNAWPD
jgi:predicted enzyme related to lactoylglutathione lyase